MEVSFSNASQTPIIISKVAVDYDFEEPQVGDLIWRINFPITMIIKSPIFHICMIQQLGFFN